jgi:hypothetical protein
MAAGWDAHALKRLLLGARPIFTRQWQAVGARIGQLRQYEQRASALTAEAISEPLASFFDFRALNTAGAMQRGSGAAPASTHPLFLGRGVFVRAGRFSVRAALTGTEHAASSDEEERERSGAFVPLAQCGVASAASPAAAAAPAVHCVMEGDDPASGVRCCRSLLLARPAHTAAADDAGAELESMLDQQAARIAAVYARLCARFHAACAAGFRAHYGSTRGHAAAVAAAVRHHFLASVSDDNASDIASLFTRELTVGVAEMSPLGHTLDEGVASAASSPVAPAATASAAAAEADDPGALRVIYVKAAVASVPLGADNTSLGAVAVGDTFAVLPPSSQSLLPLACPWTRGAAEPTLRPTFSSTAASGEAASRAGPSVLIRVVTGDLPFQDAWLVRGPRARLAKAIDDEVELHAASPSTFASGHATGTGRSAQGVSSLPHGAPDQQQGGTVPSYGGLKATGNRVTDLAKTVSSQIETATLLPASASGNAAHDALRASLSAEQQRLLEDVACLGRPPVRWSARMDVRGLLAHPALHATAADRIESFTGKLRVFERGLVVSTSQFGSLAVAMAKHVAAPGPTLLYGEDLLRDHGVPRKESADVQKTFVSWLDARSADVDEDARRAWKGDPLPESTAEQAPRAAGLRLPTTASTTQAQPTSRQKPSTNDLLSGVGGLSLSGSGAKGASGGLHMHLSTGKSAEDVDTVFSGPWDVLMIPFRSRPVCADMDALTHSVLVLLLPPDSQVRAAVVELLAGWASAAAGGLPVDDEGAAAATPGNIKFNTAWFAAYASLCLPVGVWSAAWEDRDLLERALLQDAAASQHREDIAPKPGLQDISVVLVHSLPGADGRLILKDYCAHLGSRGQVGVATVTRQLIATRLPPEFAWSGRDGSASRHAILFVDPSVAPTEVVSYAAAVGLLIEGSIACVSESELLVDDRRSSSLSGLNAVLAPGWTQAVAFVPAKFGSFSGRFALSSYSMPMGRDLIAAINPDTRVMECVTVSGTGAKLDFGAFAAVQDALSHPTKGWKSLRSRIRRALWAYPRCSPQTVLPVLAPDLYISETGIPRVLGYLRGSEAATVSLSVHTTMSMSQLQALLGECIRYSHDRAASVLQISAATSFSGNVSRHQVDGGTSFRTYRSPGTELRIPTGAADLQAIAASAFFDPRLSGGAVVVSAWSVNGLVWCATEQKKSDKQTTTTASSANPPTDTDRTLCRIMATPGNIQIVPVFFEAVMEEEGVVTPFLRFCGPALDNELVYGLLQVRLNGCRPALPPHEHLLSAEKALTLTNIPLEHATEFLPPEYMFDGTTWVTYEGHAVLSHPAGPELIASHMEVYNAAVRFFNESIDLADSARRDEAAGDQGSRSWPDSIAVDRFRACLQGKEGALASAQNHVQELAGILPTASWTSWWVITAEATQWLQRCRSVLH